MNPRKFWNVGASSLVLWSFLSAIGIALADEPKSAALIQTLPADGVWVEYNMNAKISGSEELVGTCKFQSVGRAFQGGKQCRFIELITAVNAPHESSTTIRFLIPEDEFGESKDPLSKAAKCWFKSNTDDAEIVDSLESHDKEGAMSLVGPKQNLKVETVKEKINWQQGDLECTVVIGTSEIERDNVKSSMSHRILRHKDVPFGLAVIHQELKSNLEGQMQSITVKMTLRDHGKDAKAMLPDLVP